MGMLSNLKTTSGFEVALSRTLHQNSVDSKQVKRIFNVQSKIHFLRSIALVFIAGVHDLCVTGAMLYPTELSKPHDSGRVWVRPYMFSGRNTWLKHMNSMVIGVQQ